MKAYFDYLKRNWIIVLAQGACLVWICILLGDKALWATVPLVVFAILNFAEGVQEGMKRK